MSASQTVAISSGCKRANNPKKRIMAIPITPTGFLNNWSHSRRQELTPEQMAALQRQGSVLLVVILLGVLGLFIYDVLRFRGYRREHQLHNERYSFWEWFFRFALLLVVLSVVFRMLFYMMLFSRGGYSGGRGGGGFSGGGGSFGGGGASGGW